MARRSDIDWEAIEPHYRAGIRPLKDIGIEFRVSDAAIIKHARKECWTRNLLGKIQARADAKVSASAVSAEVALANHKREDVVVEANATLQFNVRIKHRKDIIRSQNIFNVLIGELEVTSNPEGQGLIERLMDATREPETEETEAERKARLRKQNQEIERVLALPERVDTFKRLVETQDRLTQMERQAHGISDKESIDPPARVLSDVERAHRLSAWLDRVTTRIAGESSDVAAI